MTAGRDDAWPADGRVVKETHLVVVATTAAIFSIKVALNLVSRLTSSSSFVAKRVVLSRALSAQYILTKTQQKQMKYPYYSLYIYYSIRP